MENSMEVLQTIKHTTTIQFSNFTSRYFSKPKNPTNLKQYLHSEGFLQSSVSKESACNARDLGSIRGSGRPPGEGNGNPLQYSCLENPHGQKSLAGYSPWDHKLDMTETKLPPGTPKLIAALFTILFTLFILAKIRKQPTYTSVDK